MSSQTLSQPSSPALDVTEEQWDAVAGTNLKGTFFLTQALARTWVAAGTGAVVVNIGSQAGTVGIEERAAYCASKGGLDQITKVLAIEWAPHGIRVNTVAPTFVRTELTTSTLDRPGWGQTLLSRIPAGRFGEPEDIVGAVVFLAGDAAKLITGHTLLVDGGYTARRAATCDARPTDPDGIVRTRRGHRAFLHRSPRRALPTDGTALTRAAVATVVLWWTARRRVAWT